MTGHPLHLLASAIAQEQDALATIDQNENEYDTKFAEIQAIQDQIGDLRDSTADNRVVADRAKGAQQAHADLSLPAGMTIADALSSNYQGLADEVASLRTV